MKSPAIVESKSLIGIQWSANLDDAARLMVRKNIGALGVYSSDGDDLVGLVTERDITRAVAYGVDPRCTCITQWIALAGHRGGPDHPLGSGGSDA